MHKSNDDDPTDSDPGPVGRVMRHLRAQWNDKQQRGALLGLLASIGLHLILVATLATIVLRQAQNDVELISIETAQQADDPRPLEGPIEQVSLFTGESGGTEDGDNSNLKSLQTMRDLSPTEPINMDDRKVAPLRNDPLLAVPTLQIKNDFAGRGTGAKGKTLGAQGGNEASERAVKMGLLWLANHQKRNGSWSFKHGDDAPGSLANCTTGATGLALLAFLGAGHTQRTMGRGQSEYRNIVKNGLDFLISQVKRGPDGGDLQGKVVGNEGMYAHAIATLALCEALAMTKDGKLKVHAQLAVDFIVNAQDKKGGGWRYKPKEAGDTTVTGWQLMALKSAKAAELKVPEDVVPRAKAFLDSAQVEGGSLYAYTPGGGPGTPAITAIGLLCRMYLGWTPEVPALGKGVEFLSEKEPSKSDLYYNYYATQVLHHWGGEPWTKWNEVMRDQLIKTQIQEGDAAGSWNPDDRHGAGPGGKLYQTALSVMTLEVYYRYMPMYRHDERQAEVVRATLPNRTDAEVRGDRAMTYWTKLLVKRYPRMAVAAIVVCWFAVPLLADSGLTRWHHAVNNKAITFNPGFVIIVENLYHLYALIWQVSGLCFAVVIPLWLAAPLIAVEFLALRIPQRTSQIAVEK